MPRYDISVSPYSDDDTDDEEYNHVSRTQDADITFFNRIDIIYKAIRNHAHDTCVPIGEYTNHDNIANFLMRIDTKN